MTDFQLKPGSCVRVKSFPSHIGRVLEGPKEYEGGYEYLVLLDGSEGWYSGNDLEPLPSTLTPRWQSREKFLRDILLAKMDVPFTDSLYSYRASRTVFEPYQFKPVLKFLSNPEQRILIADEVGLGKTIEAAIIYLELRARLNISRILVVCPAALKQKWHDEMLNRFEEDFRDVDTMGFREVLDGYRRWRNNYEFKAIVSFETLRRESIYDEILDCGLHLDLLIVDEAHHMRNHETNTYRIGEGLADNSDAVVFLTATPLHLGNRDLYNLLHILSPSIYEDPGLFEDIVRPNRYINSAGAYLSANDWQNARTILRQVETTKIGYQFRRNPYYEKILEELQTPSDSLEKRVELQRDILELNTLSNIFTRTRKREALDSAIRAPHSIDVVLTPAEKAFYDGVITHTRAEMRRQFSGAYGFALVTKERMAASCLHETRKSFDEGQSNNGRFVTDAEQSIYAVSEKLHVGIDVANSEKIIERFGKQILSSHRSLSGTRLTGNLLLAFRADNNYMTEINGIQVHSLRKPEQFLYYGSIELGQGEEFFFSYLHFLNELEKRLKTEYNAEMVLVRVPEWNWAHRDVSIFNQLKDQAIEVEQNKLAFLNMTSVTNNNGQSIPLSNLTIQDLLRLSAAIGEVDTKFDVFEETLRNALAESPDSKALVFSTFRRTLKYLQEKLRTKGYKVEVIHGEIPIRLRHQIIEEFRNGNNFRILLSSEVGAEGLDFQFCNILINYDLPWNPMQVEQRIGRLDRFGQKHERIRIYNFYLSDTIETRIFKRLHERIDIFKSSIGDLEAILGEEIRELSRQVFQNELTPEEETALAIRAAEKIINRKFEENRFEQNKDELLGQDKILNQIVKETVDSGRVIHPHEVRALVETFLKDKFPQIVFEKIPEEPVFYLEMREELCVYLRDYSRANRIKLSERIKTVMQFNGDLPLTFDDDFARQRPRLEFITVHHVLARAAMNYWRHKQAHKEYIPATSVTITGPVDEIGQGYFFIYALDKRGVNRQRTLQPVIILDNGRVAVYSAKFLLRHIQENSKRSSNVDEDKDTAFLQMEEKASRWMAKLRDQAREEIEKRNQVLIATRTSRVRASFDAKIKRAEDKRAKVTEPRILKLYEGQIRNLKEQCEKKIAEIEEGNKVSVSYILIAGGRVTIEAEKAVEIAPTLGESDELENEIENISVSINSKEKTLQDSKFFRGVKRIANAIRKNHK